MNRSRHLSSVFGARSGVPPISPRRSLSAASQKTACALLAEVPPFLRGLAAFPSFSRAKVSRIAWAVPSWMAISSVRGSASQPPARATASSTAPGALFLYRSLHSSYASCSRGPSRWHTLTLSTRRSPSSSSFPVLPQITFASSARWRLRPLSIPSTVLGSAMFGRMMSEARIWSMTEVEGSPAPARQYVQSDSWWTLDTLPMSTRWARAVSLGDALRPR